VIGIDKIRVLVALIDLFLCFSLSGLFPLEVTSFDARQFWLCVGARSSFLLLFVIILFALFFYYSIFFCILVLVLILFGVLKRPTQIRSWAEHRSDEKAHIRFRYSYPIIVKFHIPARHATVSIIRSHHRALT
jgi:hypothetical protein